MTLGIKKPRIFDTLAGENIQGLGSANAEQHADRITRFGNLKHRARKQENYLWSLAAFQSNYENDKKSEESELATKSAMRLQSCGNYLLFKNYFTTGDVRLSKFQSCGQHLLCPFCAGIRASRAMNRYSERIFQLMSENRKLKPVLITLTVKNGIDLKERAEHMISSFRTMLDRCRDFRKKGRGFNQFCKVQGGFYSYENTRNPATEEWHPHIHIFGLIEDWINIEEFSEEWHTLTSDSYIVDVRRIKAKKGQSRDAAVRDGISEVCKYALKFGDLSVENTWEAFKVLKGKRLTGSFGLLWGVKIPDKMTDEDVENDLPYLEMLYKFVFGKKSYYDLVAVKQVEPQAKIERGGGGAERPTDRPSEIERGAITDGRGAGAGCASSHSEPAPQYVRKKAHWQVSPRTRARMRLRIRQWDGFLYNIDLSIYVENRLFQFAYN